MVLTPAYIPGIANLGADALSRENETSEWFINPIVTRRMFRRFSHPQIDLFASNRSAQVVTYFSLDRRDKLSAGTNALNQTWAFNLICFPTSLVHPFVTGLNEGVQGDIDSSHPLLVQGSLVTGTPADVISDASMPTSASEYGERPDHRQEPAIIAEAQADSMAYLRNTFQNKGADHTLAEFICGSWRDSTKNQYPLGGHDRMVWGIRFIKNYSNCRTICELSVVPFQREESGVVHYSTSQSGYCYDCGPFNKDATEPVSYD